MTEIVTLLCDPKTPVLDTVIVENLCNAWGGGDLRWLSPGEAAEFAVSTRPGKFWEHWQILQSLGIDLVSQRAQGRRKQLLLADMDSTMIEQECIDELAIKAGVGDQVGDITRRSMNGEMEFEESLRERVALMIGLEMSVIDTVLRENITLTPGGRVLVATMGAQGGYAALVSGGFTEFAAHIAQKLGFDEHRANSLLSTDGVLTGRVVEPILGRDAKVVELRRITKKLGLTSDQVMAVGDGANDLGMLQLAGAGVALHAQPSVAAQCDIRINHGDLTALLYIQGYSRQDFVD